jgi:hypothetical protein
MARIFIIDDQPQVLVISHKLRRAGHEVVHFYNGEEAVANLSAHRPDLVILDVIVPGLSGFDILRQAREPLHVVDSVHLHQRPPPGIGHHEGLRAGRAGLHHEAVQPRLPDAEDPEPVQAPGFPARRWPGDPVNDTLAPHSFVNSVGRLIADN